MGGERGAAAASGSSVVEEATTWFGASSNDDVAGSNEGLLAEFLSMVTDLEVGVDKRIGTESISVAFRANAGSTGWKTRESMRQRKNSRLIIKNSRHREQSVSKAASLARKKYPKKLVRCLT